MQDNRGIEIIADGEVTPLAGGNIGKIFYKEIIIPSDSDSESQAKRFVIKRYPYNNFAYLENSIRAYNQLKAIGVKSLVPVFEKIGRNSILMSDLNEGGEKITFDWNNHVVISLSENFQKKKLEKKDKELFIEMLKIATQDVLLASDNGISLGIDSFFISVPFEEGSGQGFDFYIGDLDILAEKDYRNTETLFTNNINIFASAVFIILHKIFLKDEDVKELGRVMSDWIMKEFSLDVNF